MGKFYAVRKGRKTGILNTWDECKRAVTGFSGAEYKSFKSLSDAEDFMNADKNVEITTNDKAIAYVDGSYNIKTKRFAYGAVIFYDGKEYEMNESFDDAELALMRNVAGEIKGAECAMRFCIDNNIPALEIYYDYQGIENWCTGEWKTNKQGTKDYKRFYDDVSKVLQIKFCKVKGHSGDKYNDKADELAKQAAGIL